MLLGWLRQENVLRVLLIGAVVILLPLAVLSTTQGAQHLITDTDPCDLTPYWVSAVLAREGLNPYATYENDMGAVKAQLPMSPDFVTRCGATVEERPPLTTPVHILLMLPFSFMDIHTAAVVWTILQIVAGVAIPLIMLRFNEEAPSWQMQLLGVLLLMSWSSTRMALGHGQITLLVIMLAAVGLLLTCRGHEVWAGLLLGIALSKFTLIGGLLVYLLIYRYYKTIGVALLVQIAGFFLLALVIGESPLETMQAYTHLVTQGADVQSLIITGVISLDRWVQQFTGLTPSMASIAVLLTGALIGVAVVLPRYLPDLLAVGKRAPGPQTPAEIVEANMLLVVLVMMTLLFSYHRIYDMPFLFIFFVPLASLHLPEQPTAAQKRVLAVWLLSAAALTAVQIVPLSIIERFVPTPGIVITVIVSAVLGVSLWLMYQSQTRVTLLRNTTRTQSTRFIGASGE